MAESMYSLMELVDCSNGSLCPGLNSCSPHELYPDLPSGALVENWTEIYNVSCNCSSWNEDTRHVSTVLQL